MYGYVSSLWVSKHSSSSLVFVVISASFATTAHEADPTPPRRSLDSNPLGPGTCLIRSLVLGLLRRPKILPRADTFSQPPSGTIFLFLMGLQVSYICMYACMYVCIRSWCRAFPRPASRTPLSIKCPVSASVAAAVIENRMDDRSLFSVSLVVAQLPPSFSLNQPRSNLIRSYSKRWYP
ncbi:hypothetical protein F4779DRAFT_559724 [Xylariaceae sp. FL0662B]|nr:hypothetical protein F4779DRAFT_559724 [Xylariaceae sp. FL0662B]